MDFLMTIIKMIIMEFAIMFKKILKKKQNNDKFIFFIKLFLFVI